MREWQPIDTSPYKGVIMLWFPDFKGAEAQFGYWHVYEDAPWTLGQWRDRDNGEPFKTGGPTGCEVFPTSWMPIPAPPSSGEG